MAEPINKNRSTDATVRALQRVQAGERPTHAARAEGIHPSTLFRAMAKDRLPQLYLVINKAPDGFVAWVEDQNYKQRSQDMPFATTAQLQAALPSLLAKC